MKFLRTPFLLEHLRWLFLKLLKSYLKDWQQRVLLNGKTSLWKNILAGFSVLGPLLFLIYINDLPDGLTRLCKIFTDDTSLFSKAVNRKKSEIEPNRDLKLASQWTYHWKMPFNPDPTKEAREVYFTYKRGNVPHEPLTFNNSKMQSALAQEHLGLILDFKLDFYRYIDDRINNCNKIIGAMRMLSMTLSRESLLIIYKSFVRSLWHYADIIYDKPCNETSKEKPEVVQYNACLTIIGAIRWTSRECLYHELGLETLNNRIWSSKLFFFHKFVKGFSLSYLQKKCVFVMYNSTRSDLNQRKS